jgi:hypothetical protein
MVDRAEALIRQCSGFGTVAMRCHVDIDGSTGLRHLEAVREAHRAAPTSCGSSWWRSRRPG